MESGRGRRHWWPGLGPAALLLVLVIGAGLRIRAALGPVTAAVPDDAFYYFGIARSIALGLPPSIDGIHPTNGYHPLWMALLVGAYGIAEASDALSPVRFARIAGGAFDIAAIVLTVGILKQLRVRPQFRVAAAAWLALNPYAVEQATNGMETSLAMCLLAATTLWHTRALLKGFGRRFVLGSGILTGLTVLGRTELILPCAALMLHVCFTWAPRRTARRLAAKCAALAGAVIAPWLVYSFVSTGTVVQSSATAMMFILWKTPLVGGLESVTPAVALERMLHSIRDAFDLTTEYLGTGLGLGSALTGAAVSSAAIGALRGRGVLVRKLQPLCALWITLPLLFFGFAAVRLYFETWHTAPFVWLIILLCAIVADTQLRPRRLAWTAPATVGAILVLAHHLAPTRAPLHLPENPANTAEHGARTDCGVDAYVMKGKITNIDGVVNNAALSALREGRLLDYVKELKPGYIYLDQYYHSSVFFGPRYREELVARPGSPELLELATAAEKDTRIALSSHVLRLDTARGREILSDGWLWDALAQGPGVRSVGTWSELVVVPEPGSSPRALELELESFGRSRTQRTRVVVDGQHVTDWNVAARAWHAVEVPADGRRHRVRLEYAEPLVHTERAPGVRWWWRTSAYQTSAVILFRARLATNP